METRQQKLIRQILDEKDEPSDNSLRAKALERALSGATPRTMTPWEWEEWYAAHGDGRKPQDPAKDS